MLTLATRIWYTPSGRGSSGDRLAPRAGAATSYPLHAARCTLTGGSEIMDETDHVLVVGLAQGLPQLTGGGIGLGHRAR